jgi:hypothetical protein
MKFMSFFGGRKSLKLLFETVCHCHLECALSVLAPLDKALSQ